MVEYDPKSERGIRESWTDLMEKTRKLREKVWGDEKLPEDKEEEKD